MSGGAPLLLPKFDYHLDESDPDVAVLRRQDGSFVAAFSAGGPPGKASSRPPRRTTRPCSGSTRARWAWRTGHNEAPEARVRLVHRSARKGCSRNFALRGF